MPVTKPEGGKHQAARRRTLAGRSVRVEDFDPGVIQRGVLAVELASKSAYLVHRAALRAVDHGDAVAQSLGVSDQRSAACSHVSVSA